MRLWRAPPRPHRLQGIFCAYVCDACEAEKKAEFKPDIFFGPYPNDEPLDDD